MLDNPSSTLQPNEWWKSPPNELGEHPGTMRWRSQLGSALGQFDSTCKLQNCTYTAHTVWSTRRVYA